MILDAVAPHWLVILLGIAALLAPSLARPSAAVRMTLLALAPLAIFAVLLAAASPVWSGEIWRGTLAWAPEIGLDWNQWLSPAGLLLGLLVSGIGTLIAIYAAGYFKEPAILGGFMRTLYIFMAAMIGLAITEQLLVLFFFWELTSVTSYLLIGFHHHKEDSRKSALDALLVTGGGGLALLAGILLLGQMGGTYLIGELAAQRETLVAHPHYLATFLCIAFGAATKSAQFPTHFWLPGAMAAPAPVSAYLHSATMVKAGVFLLLLLHPVLGGTPLWHFTLLGIGAITMTLGGVIAAVQTDLKRLLAYTTVSALGTLVMLLGIGTALAVKAAVVFFVVHAFYKGALFMIAGLLEKTTGTREIQELRGLMRTMPLTGIAAVLAAASMSGLPPFIGFIAKELLYEVKLEVAWIGWPLLVMGVIANAANLMVAIKVGVAPFLGDSSTPLIKQPPLLMKVGPLVLGVGSLLLGIFAGPLMGDAVSAVVSQARAEDVQVKLKLWHGFNLVLLLSAVTMVIGALGYLLRRFLWRLGHFFATHLGWSGRDAFRALLAAILAAADAFTSWLQSGDLRNYLKILLLSCAAILVWAFCTIDYQLTWALQSGWRLDATLVTLFIAVAAILLVRARQRMTMILLLGCIGFGIAALFGLYGAPDLAITQLLVETLTLVLLVIAIHGLPVLSRDHDTSSRNLTAWAIALLVGGLFTALTLKALDIDVHEAVSSDMAARSLPEAYGRNVVNVILVDFRALDTLGEVSVLMIAALGVAAMLRSAADTPHALLESGRSAVLLASARYTAPVMAAFSIYLLLHGHNEPGGGFIGGLLAAMASVLLHLARPDRRLTFAGLGPTTLTGLGLLLAALSGLPGWWTDGSFLAAHWGGELWLPMVGKIKFGTPLLFDIGVYAVVAGIVLLLYRSLEDWHASRKLRSSIT
jgi:multicomponent Na+:H+ antiporter subunit A